MADDNKLEVQIVLDDGSIVKGFAKVEDAAKKSADAIEQTFTGKVTDKIKDTVSELAGVFRGLNPTLVASAAAVGLLTAGFKALFELTLEGEKLRLIETQFQNLSKEAGIASEQLSGRFKDALGGLADDSDAFAVLNEGILKLGSSANALPEVFELARKASNLFGGEAIDNFRKIEEAVANGNTRTLKSIGLRVDDKKVLDAFARSLGTTADLLSEAGKQQALLNAVLEKGKDRFAAVAIENGTATESLKKLKITLNNIGEDLSINVANAFGGVFKTIIDGINSVASGISNKLKPDSIESVSKALGDINSRLIQIRNNGLESTLNGEIEALNIQKTALNQKLDILKAIDEENRKSGAAQSAKQAEAIAQITQKEFIDTEKAHLARLAAQTTFQNSLSAIDDEAAKNRLNNSLINQGSVEQERTQRELAELEHTQRIEKLYDQFYGEQFISEQQFNQLIEAEEARSATVIEGIKAKSQASQVAIVKNGLSTGLQSIGAALVKGEDLFQGFGNAVVGIFGDLFIHIGQGLLFQGLAIESFITAINSLLPGSGAAAAAAGLGLIIFGGALKALAGGGGGSASTSIPAGAGGGVAPGLGAPSEPVANPQNEAAPSGPRIEVNISGDVLDSDETGLRIVDLINKAFDQNGAVVTGNI